MHLIKNLKYHAINKGKINAFEFSQNQILIKEVDANFRGEIEISPDEIKYFSYRKSGRFTGKEYLSLKTTKGDFVFRSKKMDPDIYIKTLTFLGESKLIQIQKKIILLPLLVGLGCIALGIIVSNLRELFLICGIFHVGGAIYLFLEVKTQIRDLKLKD